MSQDYRLMTNEEINKIRKKMRLELMIARRSCLKKKGILGNLAIFILDKLTKPEEPEKHFMRDEIVDADIGFSIAELDQSSSYRL